MHLLTHLVLTPTHDISTIISPFYRWGNGDTERLLATSMGVLVRIKWLSGNKVLSTAPGT